MSEQQPSLFAVDNELLPAEHVTPAQEQVPEDQAAREAAIDPTRSILVQAPAGAGKTGLLTQRFLALLAEVEEPEQILAITFTRAATAEMRSRIVRALELASRPFPAGGKEEREVELARKALANAQGRGWNLLEQTHRLDVQTIDSLCLRLAHSQPLLARLGGSLQPAENADALHATAARRTMAQLGRARSPELESSLRLLLLRRDNNLAECERLLASMLAGRDAWLSVLPLNLADDVDWDVTRARLEQPFVDANKRACRSLYETFQAMPTLADELVAIAREAAANLDEEYSKGCDLRILRGVGSLPADTVEFLEHWRALGSLLLTASGEWRRRLTKNEGFPPPGTGPGSAERRLLKERMEQCCAALQSDTLGGTLLLQQLCQLHNLPALRYTDDQWRTLLAIFRVLRYATVELRVIFAETNAVDFIEIAQAAEQVLQDENSMRGLLESEQKRHILIDEFQDTSRAQHRLIANLLKEWREEDGRTAFVVGDPLQSIYGFRQAEVALFHQTREHGLPCGDGRRRKCYPLQLTHNFRSHRALVERLNHRFEQVFAGSASDTFVAAQAYPLDGEDDPLRFHCFFHEKTRTNGRQPAEAQEQDDTAQGRSDEVRAIVNALQAEVTQVEMARLAGADEYKIAVLVRSRSHLVEIMPALREAGIPYRAVELEWLSERAEVYDLLMLLRALLHPGERVAWLSVLRAPWCGLLLRDLHLLTGNDDKTLDDRLVPELIETRAALLSADGQRRLQRTWSALEDAHRTRYTAGNNLSLAVWLERTWMALGGPACVTAGERDNVETFLRLLDQLDPSGVEVLRGDFDRRLSRLCAAADPSVSEQFGVQLMTMHKAKGLSFHVVLVPGLDLQTRGDTSPLLAMLQRTQPETETETEVLLAPLGSREDSTQDCNYKWVMSQKRIRDAEEQKRLFYVACTRPRRRLYLFARIEIDGGAIRTPRSNSLLGAAWPALRDEAEAQFQQQQGDASRAQEEMVELPSVAEKTAASNGSGLLTLAAMAAPQAASNSLLRLPSQWSPAVPAADVGARGVRDQGPTQPLFTRSEGSLAARARGTAMHALLEHLTLLRKAGSAGTNARAGLEQTATRVLRENAYPLDRLQSTVRALVMQALAVVDHPIGSWLLAPHAGALTESTWQSWDAEGTLRTLRIDRSFIAGETAGSTGSDCLWVVDYKTGARAGGFSNEEALVTWLAAQRDKWRPQLEAYGAALRNAGTAPKPLRYGLFFPELLEFVSWSDR